MTRDDVIERLTPIASRVFNEEDIKLRNDMSAQTMDSWTSLSFMQLLTAVEEEFGFKFKMMELLKLETMGDIIDTILLHIS